MSNQKMRSLFVLFLVSFIFTCGTPPQIIYESSSPKKPEWIDNPPEAQKTLYFVGIKTGASSLEEGREAAAKHALNQIANYIRSEIKSEFQEYLAEFQQRVEHEIILNIRSKSRATIQGATVIDSYYQKMTRIENNFTLEKFNCYVLMSFSKDKALQEIERQEKEQKAKVERAYQYYIDGISLEKQKKYYQSCAYYRQALNTLKDIKEVVVLDKTEAQSSEQLLLHVKNSLQNITTKIHSVTIKIHINNFDEGYERFTSSFESAVNEKGFVLSGEPHFLISGNVGVTKSGIVMNNYVYYAEGSVSAQLISEQQTIATFPFKVKSFHRNQKQSALDALHYAGIKAGKGLVKMILDYEEYRISNKR